MIRELVRALVLALACAGATSACTSSAPTRAGDPLRPDVVVSADGAPLWRGKATFGVRSARAGKAERVVSLPGVGEIQTGIAGSETCRLVWSKDGLDALTLYEGDACGTPVDGRMCFDGARFAAGRGPAAAGARPAVLEVDGCADENDLLWSKLDGSQLASVGPTSFRQRCRKLPQKKGCDLTYVKKKALVVDSNDSGDDGFSLAFDGERWRACFLEKESGRYSLSLALEDTCGAHDDVTLAGDSADLDD